MLRNYVVAAYRNLIKNPLYAAINIVGLGIGLAACLLILLYVRGELSFEAWIPDAERIYVVQTRFDVPGRPPLLTGQSPGLAAKHLQQEFPEIEATARLHPRRPKVRRGDQLSFRRLYLVDPSFFEVIPLPFIEGDPATALPDTSSVILTRSMAEHFFGDESALGQTLSIDDNVRDREFRVTGIVEDPPKNSDFRFELIGLFEEDEFREEPWVADEWTSVNMYTYLRFEPGTDVDAIESQLPAFEERVIPNAEFGGRLYRVADFVTLSLMPIRDAHLHTLEGSQTRMVTRYVAVMTFAAVALLILFIACINFMNLSTARASQRAREVSLRKAVGATRVELVVQFLGESILLALCGLALALALVELALPTYNALLDRALVLDLFGHDSIVLWLLGLVVLVGVVGGAYPAFYLSRFEPARILKANKSSEAEGTAELRGFLVVVQFAISIALIICTIVVYRQYEFSQSKDLGFEKDHLLVVRGLGRKEAAQIASSIEAEIAALPGVLAVTRSSAVPGDSSESNSPVESVRLPTPEPLILGRLIIDHDFVETYAIDVLAGRDFDARERDDATGILNEELEPNPNSPTSVVINASAARVLGFASPEDAVGESLSVSFSENFQVPARVIGVLRDFHYKSIREQIRPTFYLNDSDAFESFTVRYEPGRGAEVNEAIARLWSRRLPDVPYTSLVLDEHLARLYGDERAQAMVFGAFSVLAVIIACLGLYGLAAFAAARRTKEIGIRKVLGASSLDIVKLLIWQFSKPVLAANLVAWPIAAWVMHDWLSSFQYRISLDPLLFLQAGLLALSIAWLTVGGHALRFSRTRPSRALRYE